MFWCSAATFCVSSCGCTGGVTWPELSNAELLTGEGVPYHLLQLSWFTVKSWQEKSGRLSDIIAVHQQTLAMLGVNYSHSHPLHQRWQQKERPVKKKQTNKKEYEWFCWHPSVSRFISTRCRCCAHQPLWLILGFATQVSWLSHAERNS